MDSFLLSEDHYSKNNQIIIQVEERKPTIPKSYLLVEKILNSFPATWIVKMFYNSWSRSRDQILEYRMIT
jgi:hypothetical protein